MDNDPPKSSTGLSNWTIYSFYAINVFIVQAGKKKVAFPLSCHYFFSMIGVKQSSDSVFFKQSQSGGCL